MPAPVSIARRESAFSPDPSRSPLLHPALSTSLSKSFGLNSPFSLSALSSSLKDLSSSPGFSSMAMSLGRSFEERPRIEAQFFKNFTCCGLDLQDLHGLLEHFEECHVAFDDDRSTDGGMDGVEMEAESEGTISGPPSPRLLAAGAHRGVFEIKKSALSSYETPPSPATQALHLDSGMELDMEMGDDDGDDGSSPSSSIGSTGSSVPPTAGGFSTQPTMAAFENPLPLHGSASKKKQQQFNASSQHSPAVDTSQGIRPSLVGFDSLASRTTSGFATPDGSLPGTPNHDQQQQGNPLDSMTFVPVGTVNPAQALGNPPPGVNVGVGGLAPSLLFPGTPAGSPPSDQGASRHSQTPEQEEDYQVLQPEEEDEDDEDDDEDDDEEEEDMGYETHQQSIPIVVASPPPASSSAPKSHKPKKASSTSAAAAAAALANLPPHPIINPHDPTTIAALANTTLKDPVATAAAIAALGPNSLAALPTALHPLGQGVQISPSGRPYTPPSEKPFKCSVPGCDKSYKQQNGLKYHRLHGHCGANAIGKDGTDPRTEGKPYVCHVASCGKRYKNMNGLRYHYQHSGAHGALGLQMLAQGCHPPPQFPPGHKRSHQLSQSFTASSASSSRASSPASHSRGASPSGLGAGVSAAFSRLG
ncbi:hypothetical protein JCM21900_001806 [Sporobolomyces salmonicolor]